MLRPTLGQRASPGTLASPGIIILVIRSDILIRLDIKALSNCEESNICFVQSVHGPVHCGVHGDRGFLREGEVSRIGSVLLREASVEFDRPFRIRTLCAIARNFVPEDDDLAVFFLDVRRCAVVEVGERGATIMRSVNWS